MILAGNRVPATVAREESWQARDELPEAVPGVITDNGPQFAARDSNEVIWLYCMTRLQATSYYPQFNGKLELR
jgi:hypothetical protein